MQFKLWIRYDRMCGTWILCHNSLVDRLQQGQQQCFTPAQYLGGLPAWVCNSGVLLCGSVVLFCSSVVCTHLWCVLYSFAAVLFVFLCSSVVLLWCVLYSSLAVLYSFEAVLAVLYSFATVLYFSAALLYSSGVCCTPLQQRCMYSSVACGQHSLAVTQQLRALLA